MKYLLDANAIIHLLIDEFPALTARVADCDAGSLATSTIAFGEVALGAERGKLPFMAVLDGLDKIRFPSTRPAFFWRCKKCVALLDVAFRKIF